MNPPNRSKEPVLIEEHVAASLQAHAVDKKHPFGLHITALMIGLIVFIGISSIALTIMASRGTVEFSDTSNPLPTSTIAPTPLPDPNALLPSDVQAAIQIWPINQPKTILFMSGTAAPTSTTTSDNVYGDIANYLTTNQAINLTVTAYAVDERDQALANLRLEYILSQLAEKKVDKKRITVSVRQLDSYTDELAADSVHLSRNTFDGEAVPL